MNRSAIAAALTFASGLGVGYSQAALAQTIANPPSDPAAPAPAAPASIPPAAAPADQAPPVPIAAAGPTPAAPASSEQPGSIATIVVNARRTAENIQSVPVAITAMSADDLKRDQITSPQDLTGRVPSLIIAPNGQMRNTESPAIRGQGAQYGTSPGVVIYYDEVPQPSDPIANNQGGPGKFFDLANVQVLKGSQGTLFGRNTTGGALLLEPNKPTPEFSASMGTGGTTYSGMSYQAVLNQPLIGRTLLLRVGGQYYERGGFTRDVATGVDYDNKRYGTGRLGLDWRAGDDIDNYLLAYYTGSHDNGTGTVVGNINRQGLNQAIPAAIGLGVLTHIAGIDLSQPANLGCALLDVYAKSLNCGQDILDEQAARGPRQVQLSAHPDDILKTGAVIDHFSYRLTDELSLRNVASYSSFRHHYRWDNDGSRVADNDFQNDGQLDEADLHTYTEELQIQGKALSNALSFVAGGYYEYTKSRGGVTATELFIESVLQSYSVDKRSFAPFAQGTYDFGGLFEPLSGLSLTLGGRYTWDDTAGTAALKETALGLVNTVDIDHPAAIKDSAPTWTAGLDYKFGHDLVYGKISRGYKTGGMSALAVNPDAYTFNPEYVTNYEIGEKSDFRIGGMPVRINSAVYYTKYNDLQKEGTDSYSPPNKVNLLPELGEATFNVGKAWVSGFEFEGTIAPLRGLTLVSNYSYIAAQYTQFTLLYDGATPQLDCTGQQIYKGSIAHLSCVPFQGVPRDQFSESVRYMLPLDASLGDLEASATYSWTDRQYSANTTLPQDEPGSWLGSFGLLNASLSWNRVMGSAFDMQLFGTNLNNKLYRIANSNDWHLTYFQSSIYAEPRFIGLQLGYHWD
jgi:iron complex outermembrane recepter protein